MTTENGFPAVLRRAMKAARITQRDFAQKCGFSQGLPPLLIKGTRTPPLEKLDVMAEALGLDATETELFREAAWLAHAPVEVRLLLHDTRLQLAQARQKYVKIIAELVRLGIQIPGITDD